MVMVIAIPDLRYNRLRVEQMPDVSLPCWSDVYPGANPEVVGPTCKPLEYITPWRVSLIRQFARGTKPGLAEFRMSTDMAKAIQDARQDSREAGAADVKGARHPRRPGRTRSPWYARGAVMTMNLRDSRR